MKKGRLIGLVLSLLLIAALMLPAMVYAAGRDNPGKPDKQRPVPATNVELVKKVVVEKPGLGPPSWANPGKGKKKAAATGVLGAAATGDRFAVVVGIADYPGIANDLDYTDDDAREMHQALTDVYGFNPANVTLLTRLKDTTRAAILTAIEEIETKALSPDDEVVFFFSGHGMTGRAEDGDKEKTDEALAVHDGTNIVPLWDGELRDAFSGFATSRIILIFDTCFAGGMKKDLEAPGRVIAMATTERGLAYESFQWQNGEFSYYFVDEGMLQGEANTHDYDGDTLLGEPGQVTVEEAFDYTKANCKYDKPTVGDKFEDDLLP